MCRKSFFCLQYRRTFGDERHSTGDKMYTPTRTPAYNCNCKDFTIHEKYTKEINLVIMFSSCFTRLLCCFRFRLKLNGLYHWIRMNWSAQIHQIDDCQIHYLVRGFVLFFLSSDDSFACTYNFLLYWVILGIAGSSHVAAQINAQIQKDSNARTCVPVNTAVRTRKKLRKLKIV